MEKKQFNFKDIKDMLNREEMKQIKGGCGGWGCIAGQIQCYCNGDGRGCVSNLSECQNLCH